MRLILQAMLFLHQIRWGLVARFTWVYLTMGILLLGFGTFLVEPSGSLPLMNLIPLMILVSFPAGLFASLLTFPFLEISPATDFLLLWLMTFLAGYIQWFHVLPNLRSGGIISLSLNQPIRSTAVTVTEGRPIELAPEPTRRISKPNRTPPLHYDKAGRTPLERAIFMPQKPATRSN